MHLKRLELIGFKSFAEKTELVFEPGITAIVGPNGCGKCLHYDSWVSLGDGSIIKIGDLVETALKDSSSIEKLDDGVMVLENPKDIKVLSLNTKTLKIESRVIHAFIKRKAPEYLLKVETKSGKTVITTHYHPFFSIQDGLVVQLKAQQLKEGIRIAVSRILSPIESNSKLINYENSLYVSYSEGLSNFLKGIKTTKGNQIGEKSRKLEQIKEVKLKTNPDSDLIPGINGIFKELVKLSGIKVKKFRKISPRLVAYYENRCLPTRQGLLEALAIIAEHAQLTGLPAKLYKYLETLAHSDIYWDEVVSIEKIYSEKWVYDLSILHNHNFVAQDIIVHNSNIFDAIRWVLGEQSVKALRGSNMEDVIFNGTDTSPALNMAEVSLTFTNENRQLPVDADEIMISRRIFRSGESEYLINKTAVRLKDILELFMGTGIGAEAYSLVEQGKIDLILSTRPEDRRLVFDEASGITKYKLQKKEALRKLEETEGNLIRINDIILEVKRQISSLERQANKARRYKEVLEELKAKEISLGAFKINEINKQRQQLHQNINELEEKQLEKATAISTLEERLSQAAAELKSQERKIVELNNEIINLDNLIQRNIEHIKLNKERIADLESRDKLLQESIGQLKDRSKIDEEKLIAFKKEYEAIEDIINDRSKILQDRQLELENLDASIHSANAEIKAAKARIWELASAQAKAKNDLIDITTKIQMGLNHKKRLDIDLAKCLEEEASFNNTLAGLDGELNSFKSQYDELGLQISSIKNELDNIQRLLSEIIAKIKELENLKLGLQSQKEFIEKLILRYQDISESMNAVVIVDQEPKDEVSGLVIKVNNAQTSEEKDSAVLKEARFKFKGEAKAIALDVDSINNKINEVSLKIQDESNRQMEKERTLGQLGEKLRGLEDSLRQIQISISNKSAQRDVVLQGLNKLRDEKGIIELELSDTSDELDRLSVKRKNLDEELAALDREKERQDETVVSQQELISTGTQKRQECLVLIAKGSTELESLRLRKEEGKTTLKILQDSYHQEIEDLRRQEEELAQIKQKKNEIALEIEKLKSDNNAYFGQKQKYQESLEDLESGYRQRQENFKNDTLNLENQRQELESLKNESYQLKMQEQELNFKSTAIKDRIKETYKVDLESLLSEAALTDSRELLEQEISRLKEKLDSYGTVNLVAIEEYDELKKRYDFLTQQQNDLLTAKESLSEAISKINRTTKQMFLETFERVCAEFKNYFRLLFNGGDAKLFLVDEQDPLESGIEIIARPPGKKLQNVLLLSGGEKSLTAIALLFAIFKVKPVSFCILDEVDAALDEANVDRFGRMLFEFTKTSQFILITHNKKTIANADVMYGITMENSGISKIVSVKFSCAKDKTQETQEPEKEVSEPV